MSRPGDDPAVPDRQARGYRGMPAGLLEKLMAAVRPEFRADDLVFDPRDPVFGGAACVVGGCSRPHRKRGLCVSHWQRWRASGTPDLAEFTATAAAGWYGHLPLGSCVIDGCNYGRMAREMCHRHARQWYGAGRPELGALAGLAGAAAAADLSAAGLPDRLLRPVGSGHVGVLPRPRWPVEDAAAAPMRRSSSPPAKTQVPARSTSTCGSCPLACALRCSMCCSAAAMSGPPGSIPGNVSHSSRSWPPRARRPF